MASFESTSESAAAALSALAGKTVAAITADFRKTTVAFTDGTVWEVAACDTHDGAVQDHDIAHS